jgi:hypothetical protein
MEKKSWNLNQKQFETKQAKKKVCQQYDDEVRMLQRELSTKVDRLKMERDRKLDEISLEYAKYEDEYRQWKRENMKVLAIIEDK